MPWIIRILNNVNEEILKKFEEDIKEVQSQHYQEINTWNHHGIASKAETMRFDYESTLQKLDDLADLNLVDIVKLRVGNHPLQIGIGYTFDETVSNSQSMQNNLKM
ncbi:hypothetical protein V6M85_06140 [Sulfolobus tengchongensis]|uniref:Uncharacterized protein n=1 Tax=Sulfolobus tengchongensis TaxID=207809 RepID=A0AAX4L4R1_9CREN